jgi:hypothetical protein
MKIEKPLPALTFAEAEAIQWATQLREERNQREKVELQLVEARREITQLKAKIDHFIKPETKPHSIDDATAREWDLCSVNDYLRKRIQELDVHKPALDAANKRCDGLITMFKVNSDAREKDFAKGQAALLHRALHCEAENARLLQLLNEIKNKK